MCVLIPACAGVHFHVHPTWLCLEMVLSIFLLLVNSWVLCPMGGLGVSTVHAVTGVWWGFCE